MMIACFIFMCQFASTFMNIQWKFVEQERKDRGQRREDEHKIC
jgi:hypothetical protein